MSLCCITTNGLPPLCFIHTVSHGKHEFRCGLVGDGISRESSLRHCRYATTKCLSLPSPAYFGGTPIFSVHVAPSTSMLFVPVIPASGIDSMSWTPRMRQLARHTPDSGSISSDDRASSAL